MPGPTPRAEFDAEETKAPVGVHEAQVTRLRSKSDETRRASDQTFAEEEAATRMEAAG